MGKYRAEKDYHLFGMVKGDIANFESQEAYTADDLVVAVFDGRIIPCQVWQYHRDFAIVADGNGRANNVPTGDFEIRGKIISIEKGATVAGE